jgi:hypothetical protein
MLTSLQDDMPALSLNEVSPSHGEHTTDPDPAYLPGGHFSIVSDLGGQNVPPSQRVQLLLPGSE